MVSMPYSSRIATTWWRLPLPAARVRPRRSTEPVVLLIGAPGDDHLDRVGHQLNQMGLPWLSSTAGEDPKIPAYDPTKGPSSVVGIFYRALPPPARIPYHGEESIRFIPVDESVDASVGGFMQRERGAALYGLAQTATCTVMNTPSNHHAAMNKPYQMRVAQSLGLKVPRSVIASDICSVREFANSLGRPIVYKAINDSIAWESESTGGFVYTSHFDLKQWDTIEHAGLFQELLTARRELRITWIDGVMFIVENDGIDEIDCRKKSAKDLEYRPTSICTELCIKIDRLMDQLGLKFGAIDLLETDEDVYFLEVNPHGAFGWLEDIFELKIAKTIAERLHA